MIQISPTSRRAKRGPRILRRGAAFLLSSPRRFFEPCDQAIAQWRRAVDLDSKNFDALFNLASTLASVGRVAEARPYMTQFVQTAPRGFYARDIERFRQFLSRSPSE